MNGDIVAELREAQAALARVRALADEWDAIERATPYALDHVYAFADALREALEPRQTRARAPLSDDGGAE